MHEDVILEDFTTFFYLIYRVIVTATYKKTANLKLHLFSNVTNDDPGKGVFQLIFILSAIILYNSSCVYQ